MKNVLCEHVKSYVDCYQFAYTKKRSVEDAVLTLSDFVLKHVEQANNLYKKHFVKILFVDFSSAFNTIQPHLMMQKLNNMKVNPYIILWINQFLTARLQYVKYLGTQSDMIITNTGAPQGCVLSPLLFTLYTSDCRCNGQNTQLFKYADDTALVGRCVNTDVNYRNEVTHFVNWCESNYLELDVQKTKEMIIDFQKSPAEHIPLCINNENVEIVKEYKYLGTIIDNSFNFNKNVDVIFKKTQSRMYFVRQLIKLKINVKILNLFYSSILQSVICFSIVCWYGNCSVDSKLKLSRVIRNCEKLGVMDTIPLQDLYEKFMVQRSKMICSDNSHPLCQYYKMLPSGKRYQSIRCRTSRYMKSFLPSSIRIMNKLCI